MLDAEETRAVLREHGVDEETLDFVITSSGADVYVKKEAGGKLQYDERSG